MGEQSFQSGRKGVTSLLFFLKYPWDRVVSYMPNFEGHVSQGRSRSGRDPCYPFLPSKLFEFTQNLAGASRVYDILKDIMEHIFTNLQVIETHLQFWECRGEGSNGQKLCFMMFERGPLPFFRDAIKLLCQSFSEESVRQPNGLASSYIFERIAQLSMLRRSIATFLAQVYMEVNKCEAELAKDPEKPLLSLLITINYLFLGLESSIGHLNGIGTCVFHVNSSSLMFGKIPDLNEIEWSESRARDVVNVLCKNLEILDSFLSDVIAKYKKPGRMSLNWVRYSCYAMGLSVCSMWILQHSQLMGSPDIDNWIQKARDLCFSFFSDHVEQPIASIRDELFETFRKRHKGVMHSEEVELTANSLHKMLLAFSEQTIGHKLEENASDQEMLEIVVARYEKELMHPIQNLLSGELARALLIQVQKLKLDIETAMLELDQILKANEINFAALAALPAFFLFIILLMLFRALFKRDGKAEGKGRNARMKRQLLLIEIEKKVMQHQSYVEQGQESESQYVFGLLLCCLRLLLKGPEGDEKETEERKWLRQDVADLGRPDIQAGYKMMIVSRMAWGERTSAYFLH